MATAAGGPCVCIASSKHRPSVYSSSNLCREAGSCRDAEAAGTVSAGVVGECRAPRTAVRVKASYRSRSANSGGVHCSGVCIGSGIQAAWRNKARCDEHQGKQCSLVALPRRTVTRQVGLVNATTGVVWDYRLVRCPSDKLPAAAAPSRNGIRYVKLRPRRQRCLAARTGPRFAPRIKTGRFSSPVGSFRERMTYCGYQAFKIGPQDVVENVSASMSPRCFGMGVVCTGCPGALPRVWSSSRVYRGRSRDEHLGRPLERPIALIAQAAGNGQFDVSSEGRDVRATKTRNDGKLVGERVGESSQPLTDAEEDVGDMSRDIASVALSATIAAEISTNELVEAEAARLSRALRSGSFQDSARRLSGEAANVLSEPPDENLLAERLIRRLASLQDAESVLAKISEAVGGAGRVLSNEECSNLIRAALAENNVDLAYSILNAMRCSLLIRKFDSDEGSVDDAETLRWRWPQANVTTYAALVRGLAASLRVSDALQTVADVRRRGVPSGDEVPFGKVVTCPTCKTALAVVQPQHGIQLVPCSKCRYQYELMSGDVISCECESVSGDVSFFEKSLRILQLVKRPVPAAVQSIVVRTPDGLARTHRFATESADLAAQEGERVTVALAAPVSAGRGIGPLKISTRAPGWRPSEPMSITSHESGRVADLIRPPPKSGSGASFDSSVIVPAAVFLASSDAASALIDPTLPRTIAVGAAAAVALSGAANAFVFPKMNQLPQKAVDVMALRQQLLAQHEKLQERLEELTQAAAEEVRMLARMCQLENKMEAVGESSYSARIARVQKARDGLDERLSARLELIDSYAKVASMIEIEVEMDVDVLAAEAAGAAASIAEQIERLMEVESLQQEWRNQAEAGDEVERLLRSSPTLPEP